MSKTSLVVHNLLVASYELEKASCLLKKFQSCSESVQSLVIFKVKLLNRMTFLSHPVLVFHLL